MSLKTIFAGMGSWFEKEKPIVDDAFAKANSIVNILKSFEASVPGQAVLAVVGAFVGPNIIPAITNVMSTFFTDFGLAAAEEAKPVHQIVADGFNAVSTKLTGSSKALALGNLATVIGTAIDNSNGGTTTIQQGAIIAPVVYNPAIMSDPPAAAKPVK